MPGGRENIKTSFDEGDGWWGYVYMSPLGVFWYIQGRDYGWYAPFPSPPPSQKIYLEGMFCRCSGLTTPLHSSLFFIFSSLSLTQTTSLSLLYCSSFDLSFTSYTLTTLFLFSSNSLSILLFFSLNEVLNIFLNIRIDIIYDHRNQCKMLKKK